MLNETTGGVQPGNHTVPPVDKTPHVKTSASGGAKPDKPKELGFDPYDQKACFFWSEQSRRNRIVWNDENVNYDRY